MRFWRKRERRYVARDLNWRPILNVATGVVDDLQPDEPSTLNRTGVGWETVTTLSNARRIARWANRKEGR